MMAVRKRSIIGGAHLVKRRWRWQGVAGGGDVGETCLVEENKLIARIYPQGWRRGPRRSEQQVSGLRVCSDFSPSFTVIVLWLLSRLRDLRESFAETMKKQQMPQWRRTRLCFRQCFPLSPVIRGICWRTGPSALMTRYWCQPPFLNSEGYVDWMSMTGRGRKGQGRTTLLRQSLA